MLEVIRRECAVARGERRPPAIRQLVGVQTDCKSAFSRGIEVARRLRGRKSNRFAKRVDRIRQAFACNGRQHLIDDERHDGRLDGDPALPFQGKGICLCVALVDAPELVDNST